ncbi:hypothetical protein CBER1_11916 [Cercospora berteroae]|uniref:CCHC-type domain-containing protein n=1 Tax=Cercospora berteroae TaxID=357750 RepID=A0A2S6C0F6_9PEZI|nr:hypothetical protein CBER1_11916 [Cercospora berteroae]
MDLIDSDPSEEVSTWLGLLQNTSSPDRQPPQSPQSLSGSDTRTITKSRSEPRFSSSTEGSSSFVTNPPLSPEAAAAAATHFVNTGLVRSAGTFNLTRGLTMSGDMSGLSGVTVITPSMDPGTFNNAPGQNVKKYLGRLETYFRDKNVTGSEDRIRELYQRLEGEVDEWIDRTSKVSRITVKKNPSEADWEAFKEALIQKFKKKTQPVDLHRITTLMQKDGQDLEDYYNDACELLDRAEVEDASDPEEVAHRWVISQVCDKFINGLRNEETQRALGQMAPTSANSILTLKATYEKAVVTERAEKKEEARRLGKQKERALDLRTEYMNKLAAGAEISEDLISRLEACGITGLRPQPNRSQSGPAATQGNNRNPYTSIAGYASHPAAPNGFVGPPPVVASFGQPPYPGLSAPFQQPGIRAPTGSGRGPPAPTRPRTPDSVQMNPWQMAHELVRREHPAWDPSHSQNRIITGEDQYTYRGPGTGLCHKCGTAGHQAPTCILQPLGVAEQAFLRNLTRFQVEKAAAIREARGQQSHAPQAEARLVRVSASEDDYSTDTSEQPLWEPVPQAWANKVEAEVFLDEANPGNKRGAGEEEEPADPKRQRTTVDLRCDAHQKVENPDPQCVGGQCEHLCCKPGARIFKEPKAKKPRAKRQPAIIRALEGQPAINITDILTSVNIPLNLWQVAQLSPKFREELRSLIIPKRAKVTRARKPKATAQGVEVASNHISTDIIGQVTSWSQADRTLRAFSLPAKVWKDGSPTMLTLPRNLVVADQGSDINIAYPPLKKMLDLQLLPLAVSGTPMVKMTVADGTYSELRHFVVFNLVVEGIVRKVWALYCPSKNQAGNHAVALLLGVPYLTLVSAKIDVRANYIDIGDATAGEPIVRVHAPNKTPISAKTEETDDSSQAFDQLIPDGVRLHTSDSEIGQPTESEDEEETEYKDSEGTSEEEDSSEDDFQDFQIRKEALGQFSDETESSDAEASGDPGDKARPATTSASVSSENEEYHSAEDNHDTNCTEERGRGKTQTGHPGHEQRRRRETTSEAATTSSNSPTSSDNGSSPLPRQRSGWIASVAYVKEHVRHEGGRTARVSDSEGRRGDTQARLVPNLEKERTTARSFRVRHDPVRGPDTREWDEGEGPLCRCGSTLLCVRHMHGKEAHSRHITTRSTGQDAEAQLRPVERLPTDTTQDYDTLKRWIDDKGITLGDRIPESQRLEVMRVLWTYRELGSAGQGTLGPPTDLIQHRMRIKDGTPIYKARNRMMARDKEWWYRKFATEGLENGMFERSITANGRLSQWGADPVLVRKPGKTEPRLTFNYHYVWEEPPGNQMQLSRDAHAYLGHPSHATFSQFDLKNAYWTVQIHPDDRHYLAFSVPGIGQLQPTRMAMGARSSSFTMNELGNIAFGPLKGNPPEPSFLHNTQGPENPPDMTFYIDDMFCGHSSWGKQWAFIRDHLLPRLRWAKLKLSFDKVKIGVSEMLALGEIHHIGGKISPKPQRVQKILDWPTPQTQTDVRSFMGSILMCRQWIKNFAEIARPLTRLQSNKVEWRWEGAEELAFTLLKNKAATTILLHGWDPALPIEMYVDASKFAAGCYIRQKQNGVYVPLLYDSFTFTPTERNYDTYKRELKAMVVFCEKHGHMLQNSQKSIVWTDHQPLTTFLKGGNHADIFFRWLERVRPFNMEIKHVAGKRNLAADGLSRTVFPAGCNMTADTKEILAAAGRHTSNEGREWFWKTGKGGYEEMLREMKAAGEREEMETEEKEVEVRRTEAIGVMDSESIEAEGTREVTARTTRTRKPSRSSEGGRSTRTSSGQEDQSEAGVDTEPDDEEPPRKKRKAREMHTRTSSHAHKDM